MTTASVITLTMNPALDLSTTVDTIVPYQKLRCGPVRRDPGGGGINVSRVVTRLGGRSIAVFPAGGPTGQALEQLVNAEGVAIRVVRIAGDTREDFTVFENETGNQFRFVTPGPVIAEEDWRAIIGAFESLLEGNGFAVVSGSLPPGAPDDFFAIAARAAKAKGAKLAVDCSGTGLRAAVHEGLFLIKPNQREFAELMGLAAPDSKTLIAAAREFIAAGNIASVALTLAEEGAVLVTREGALRARAPQVKAVSTVGAGDSFLGALIWSLADGQDWRDALRLGVAAGSAALLSAGTDLAHPQAIRELAAGISVEELA